MPKKKRKVTVPQALGALRPMKRKEADVVLVVRGRLGPDGAWETDWEAAHWMPDLDDSLIAPSGLPAGFGMAAAKEVGSITAGDTAEESLGRFGAAVGKGLISAIETKLGGGLHGDET